MMDIRARSRFANFWWFFAIMVLGVPVSIGFLDIVSGLCTFREFFAP